MSGHVEVPVGPGTGSRVWRAIGHWGLLQNRRRSAPPAPAAGIAEAEEFVREFHAENP